MDSGIDATHPHFTEHDNLNLTGVPPLIHRDLVALDGNDKGALVDKFGHGTHVAGIIAGAMRAEQGPIEAQTRFRDESGEVKERIERPRHQIWIDENARPDDSADHNHRRVERTELAAKRHGA